MQENAWNKMIIHKKILCLLMKCLTVEDENDNVIITINNMTFVLVIG